jgi:PAS domain S-box-containing protein
MNQGISVADRDLRLVGVNRRFGELLNLPERLCRPGVAAEDIFRFNAHRGDYGPGDPEAKVQERLAVARLGLPHRFERTLSDGRVIEVQGQPLPDGGFVSTYTDITERARAQRALVRFRAAMDLSSDGVYLIDLDAMRIVDCNDGACRMLGYPREELVGLPVQRVAPARDPDRLRAEADALERAVGAAPAIRVEHRRRDGTMFPVEVNRHVLQTDAGRVLVAVARDLSEREATEAQRASLESQLREAQKMEAIGTLAGGIAHDFNNLLAVILGHLNLLRATVAHDGSAPHHLDHIENAGLRARDLVRQLLAFARRHALDMQVQELHGIVRQTLSMLRAVLPAGVALEFTEAATPVHVLADTTQVQQVLLNLCTNAWQAMPGGGRIRVTVTRHDAGVQRGDLPPGPHACIAVEDTGAGIDAQALPRIFEPFYTTKPPGTGTGLGLSVAQGIVRAHGGTIGVRSVLGVGTTFEVFLPCAEPASPAPRAVPPPAAAPVPDGAGAGRLVVCVDDDAVVLLVTAQQLERAGLRVRAFDDPRAAFEALSGGLDEAACLVCDHNMPGMSGLDLVRQLRRRGRRLPAVLGSGFVDQALRAEADGAGVQEVLHKEEFHEVLVPVVMRMVAQHEASDARHAH